KSVVRSPRRLRPAAVWAIALIAVVAATADGWLPEIRPAESLFVAAVALTAVAAFALVTRRILLPTVLAAARLAIVRAVSVSEQDSQALPLHAYDLVTLATSSSAQAALWANHRVWIVALLAAIAASAVLAAVAWRFDGTRMPRLHALAAIPACI